VVPKFFTSGRQRHFRRASMRVVSDAVDPAAALPLQAAPLAAQLAERFAALLRVPVVVAVFFEPEAACDVPDFVARAHAGLVLRVRGAAFGFAGVDAVLPVSSAREAGQGVCDVQGHKFKVLSLL
jgi:hypothetical protein